MDVFRDTITIPSRARFPTTLAFTVWPTWNCLLNLLVLLASVASPALQYAGIAVEDDDSSVGAQHGLRKRATDIHDKDRLHLVITSSCTGDYYQPNFCCFVTTDKASSTPVLPSTLSTFESKTWPNFGATLGLLRCSRDGFMESPTRFLALST